MCGGGSLTLEAWNDAIKAAIGAYNSTNIGELNFQFSDAFCEDELQVGSYENYTVSNEKLLEQINTQFEQIKERYQIDSQSQYDELVSSCTDFEELQNFRPKLDYDYTEIVYDILKQGNVLRVNANM